MLVDLALGREVDPVMTYRTGVRSRWWWGDVDHLLLRMLRNDVGSPCLPAAPGRSRALRDFLSSGAPGDRSEILRLSDPLPFLRETWNGSPGADARESHPDARAAARQWADIDSGGVEHLLHRCPGARVEPRARRLRPVQSVLRPAAA